MFICNERAWSLIQRVLGDYLAKFRTDGTFLYSKAANGYVKVGSTFDSYEYGGEKVAEYFRK